MPGSADPLSSVDAIPAVAERLEYRFVDPALLRLALTHRSWCAENGGVESNERLEFLGDAVLGLAVAGETFARFEDLSEGNLAKVRAAVVSGPSLAAAARRLDLGADLLLGKGEATSGGNAKQSILADAMEAVIGAVYVDGGWAAAQELVLRLFSETIEDGVERPGVEDHKTRLQEIVAKLHKVAPEYSVRYEGPDHARIFHATVRIDGSPMGEGSGTSKKAAEQHAAAAAWQQLQRTHPCAATESGASTQLPPRQGSENHHG